MPRTRARFTQNDLARAARVAKSLGMSVRVLPDGTIELAEKAAEPTPVKPLEARREFSL